MPEILHILVLDPSGPEVSRLIHELEEGGVVAQWSAAGRVQELETALEPLPDLILANHSRPIALETSIDSILEQLELDVPVIFFDRAGSEQPVHSVVSLGNSAAHCGHSNGEAMGLAASVRNFWIEWSVRRERDRMAAALRCTEARLQLATEASNIGTWDWNLLTNQVYFSPEWKQQIGHAPHEVSDRYEEWESRLHPADRDRILNAVLAFRSGQAKEYDVEFRLRHKNGSYRWIHTRGKLMRSADGTPTQMLGCHIDVTERKLALERLSEQAELLNHATDAIIVHDLDNRITYWNRGAELLYGWSAEEALGKCECDLIFQDPSIYYSMTDQTMKQGAYRGELHHHSRDGSERLVEGLWTLIRDEQGDPKSILTVNTDVTEHRRIENQMLRTQRLESLGTLAGGIAHDLNNVLGPILMSVETLKEEVHCENGRKILKTLESCAQRGAHLVRQVLSFARGMEGELVEINFRHLLNDIRKIIGETFPKNIRVEMECQHGLWLVKGDPTQFHQVLMNLCVNARDAMPDGGTLTLRAENADLDEMFSRMSSGMPAGEYVMVTVEDTGSGIPDEIQERIYDPFFSTKAKGEGTGLGLSTTLGIVKRHGGFIHLNSAKGKGTRFQVYFPNGGDQAEEDMIHHAAILPRGNGECLMLVDDEECIRQATQRTLKRHGYRSILAAHGAEAVSLYARHREEIAAVITDMAMPVMDGRSTIFALRAINPTVKVLACSGMDASHKDLEDIESATIRWISKPYSTETLLRELASLLSQNTE